MRGLPAGAVLGNHGTDGTDCLQPPRSLPSRARAGFGNRQEPTGFKGSHHGRGDRRVCVGAAVSDPLAGTVRIGGALPGGDWNLRCHVLLGQSTHARDRHPHGAGCATVRSHQACFETGLGADARGSQHWAARRARPDAPRVRHALRSSPYRSPDLCRSGPATDCDCPAR